MDLNEFERKLYAAARQAPVDDRVPFAFEKRVMARLAAERAVDPAARLAALLWRAAAPCMGIALVLCAWSCLSPVSVSDDFSSDLEAAVVAVVEHEPAAGVQW